jgi:hypothetical protein
MQFICVWINGTPESAVLEPGCDRDFDHVIVGLSQGGQAWYDTAMQDTALMLTRGEEVGLKGNVFVCSFDSRDLAEAWLSEKSGRKEEIVEDQDSATVTAMDYASMAGHAVA